MNLTDGELKERTREHIVYEVEMLLKIKELYLTGFPIDPGYVLRMAFIESFAIHLRNLINFLYPDSDYPTDIYAKHFFATPSGWDDVKPKLPANLKEARRRANKEVGHLTLERISGTIDPSKEWKMDELTDEIVPILKLFSSSANKKKLDESISRLPF